MSDLTDFTPPTDNGTDLGSGAKRWKDIYAGNAVIQTSDVTLKRDITPCSNGLAFIMKLQPVDFKFTDGERVHSGFLAQQVESVLPADRAVVVKEAVSGLYGVRYSELIAPVVSAIQELNDKVDSTPMSVDVSNDLFDLRGRIQENERDIISSNENYRNLSEELSDINEKLRCVSKNPPLVEDLKPVLQSLQQRVDRVEGVHRTVLDAAEHLEERVNDTARQVADAVLSVDKMYGAMLSQNDSTAHELGKRIDDLQVLVETPRKKQVTLLEVCLVVGVVVDFALHFLIK
jgi:hypothetical protein